MLTLNRPTNEGIRSDADIRECRTAMHFYRRQGYQPLPSRTDRKAPCCPYGEFWTSPVPKHVYDCHRTPNTQVMTGAHWGLVVIDLDGPIAIEAWRSMTLFRPAPPTWEVYSDPDGGRHLWFSLPPGTTAVESRTVWRLDGAKHAGIEILGDRKLVMAPPSIHPTTGHKYRFAESHTPRDLRQPAVCPGWVLAMPNVQCVDADSVRTRAEPARRFDGPRPAGSYEFRDVIRAIPDGEVVPLVRSWGVRVASSRPNSRGWWQCHSIRRDDLNPSAGINEQTKYYVDLTTRERLSIFDLAVERGVFGSWPEACNHLGERYAAKVS